VLNSRAVNQGQPRIKRGLCLALVDALELLSVWRRDTAEMAHNIDDIIVNVLGNPIKNDIAFDVVYVYGRFDNQLLIGIS
jgi:hypothetical protein